MKRIAIVGGGIAGLTAAWQLSRNGNTRFTLFEASGRLGGTVETIQRDGFTVECGPDGWVTEKPWARTLAEDLGLGSDVVPSNDATRKTWILSGSGLVAMPDGMRMMVPTDLAALDRSPLFSAEAKHAYAQEPGRAAELYARAPVADESVASFVRRHFGEEVLAKIGAPLLSGVFGGDVATLSVRAVMPAFVAMEREHGSLIAALQSKTNRPSGSVFTSLRSGTGALIERMSAEIAPSCLRMHTPVLAVAREPNRWAITTATGSESFDSLLMAAPAHVAAGLLLHTSPRMAELMQMQASSAVLAALAFDERFDLPQGFGFLVPAGTGGSQLLAGTFVDQKFPHRAPPGKRLLRAFFGGEAAQRLAPLPDASIAALAFAELEALLGALPTPRFSIVRRWPRSLPQYAVGHLDRMAELQGLTPDDLYLLGNGYRGVGLPDLIRDARNAANSLG
jgi:oxygen-dependent protoporphyrinogen oxidase